MSASIGLNVADGRGGIGRRLLDKYGFRFNGLFLQNDCGFKSISELKTSTETISYRAGGSLIPVKRPGLSSFDPVTLTRGASLNVVELEGWYRQVTAANEVGVCGAQGKGASSPNEYKDVGTIAVLNRRQEPIFYWQLVNAWPSDFTPADGWDADSSENVFESLVLQYDYFERISLFGSQVFTTSSSFDQTMVTVGATVGLPGLSLSAEFGFGF